MTKSIKGILLTFTLIILLFVFFIAGRFAEKNSTENKISISTPMPDHDLPSVKSTSTEIPVKNKYVIILKNNTLRLYDNNKIIKETEIFSHVLPHTDVDVFSSGVEYLTIEDALLDWESLCK